MVDNKSILHELYVFSEWKPEPEYIQKSDNILPENISSLWRWLKFFGPKKSLIDSVAAHKERQQKWHIALGDEGKVIAVLTDNILEIRTKRSEYATIAARTTVSRDAYAQWRKLVWSPDCSFIVVAYGNGVVSFFDLTASNLFNIPVDCSRPGGLECTDNTHAVSEIIFIPLRVQDTKWNWEVLVVTYDGKLRGYLVSQTDGFKLHHTFQFPGGVASACYCDTHATLYIAGVPRAPHKEASSPVSAGITAWRVLNDEPFYMLSVVSNELEAQLANERFHLYIPVILSKNMNFIIRMAISPDNSKLVCVHCNGDVSIWRLPVLKGVHQFKLAEQPQHELQNPLTPEQGNKDQTLYHPADVSWWSNEEVILSRFSGAVSVCGAQDLVNILGDEPVFFQGTPQVTAAYNGAFMALECESTVLPAKKSGSDESMEVVKTDAEVEGSMMEMTKELFKSVLYAITDIETFQPKPKKITIVSRIYRLLGVKSTTPMELFSRKIESGSYEEALSLAARFELDSDLVYQQQWRKNPVSSDAIQNYLSKVSKKIWAVHQCVDRLPESMPAAKELLSFGLELTNEKILDEINGSKPSEEWKDPDSVTMEDLNAYTSELLRCRHIMLFYKERLNLYEAILHYEKSTYVKAEYHRLRSNSLFHSAMEIAKEGRIEALTCLWPYIHSPAMRMSILHKLPETTYPPDFQHLLPSRNPQKWFDKMSPIKIKIDHVNDWCRKEIFRPIWSSDWSEESPPVTVEHYTDSVVAQYYDVRARAIERDTGLVSHALALVALGSQLGALPGADPWPELVYISFHLTTLATLLYDVNVEDVSLNELETLSHVETCKLLMKMSTHETYRSDLKKYVLPYLLRYEAFKNKKDLCFNGFMEYLESVSIEDLSYVLLVLQVPREFGLNVHTQVDLVERCLFAHTGTEQLELACDLINAILKETDGSITASALVRRVGALERAVAGSARLALRGVRAPPCALRRLAAEPARAVHLLLRVAHDLRARPEKPTVQDWENLLKDMLELRSTILDCVTVEQCYEIYVSTLLSSGDAASIRLAAGAAAQAAAAAAGAAGVAAAGARMHSLATLALHAANEYFNSASSLVDPAVENAKCCLLLIEDRGEDIKRELDLIAALPILHSFNISMLPVQVRLCKDKMELIEKCMRNDPSAIHESHKLLELARLLRIAEDDEQTREGMVLTRVVTHALAAGGAGGAGGAAAAARAARRLAALRHAAAAPQLAAAAAAAPDTAERRRLLAAAAAFAEPHLLENILHDRLKLELESLEQMGVAIKDNNRVVERWPSTEDEFSDAVTTPVIEKKDLVPPAQAEKKITLLTSLLDTFYNKFTISSEQEQPSAAEAGAACPEFYRLLQAEARGAHFAYDRFSVVGAQGAAHALLHAFYTLAALHGHADNEDDVIQKCSSELLHVDTALAVAALLRARPKRAGDAGGAGGAAGGGRMALAAALYAAAVRTLAPRLGDHVYLAEPKRLVYMVLSQRNIPKEQKTQIQQYIDKLGAVGDVDRIREQGLSVNGLLFNADQDYKMEVICRLARLGRVETIRLACDLATKYKLDAVGVWLEYAANSLATIEPSILPNAAYNPKAYKRIRETLWPVIRGNDYAALINFFSVLMQIDDKAQMYGLTATEHIKLLQKARGASPELDYKLVLSAPPAEQLTRHVLAAMRPDSVAALGKWLRALPPALRPRVPLGHIYTKWLTGYFFSEATSGTSKKWMQQWRQCASYFTKLSKNELLEFVAAVCFSEEALQRVPQATRHVMIMQAVDYCQQENDFKGNKNEQTWAQAGAELARWARFLENFHSPSVQALVAASDVPAHLWAAVEMSYGRAEALERALAAAARAGLRGAALASLLQCVRARASPQCVLRRALDDCADADDMELLVTRIVQYHKEGIKFSDEFLEEVMDKAAGYGVPPHKQMGLLSISQRAKVQDGDDLLKIAQFSVDLFKTEWPESECAQQLTASQLASAEGRQAALRALAPAADTRARRRALADALACWPHTIGSEGRSLQCEYARGLLAARAPDALLLLRLLLRRPTLTDQEVKWLAENASESLINTIWVVLLSRCDCSEELLRNLLLEHKGLVQNEEIEPDLIKEVLDQGMFIKMVSTPLYSSIVSYILDSSTLGDQSTPYTIEWATRELIKANYLAEAGHLELMAVGIPPALQGFSQSVLYTKNMLKP